MQEAETTDKFMIFIPVAILVFIGLVLLVPVVFLLGYFNIVVIGFEKLGISPEATAILFLAILIGSLINIPLGRTKLIYVEKKHFFGLFKKPEIQAQGTAINVGGGLIPLLLSFYFLIIVLLQGFSTKPILIATLLMVIVSKLSAKVVPGKGILITPLVPPAFAFVFALALAPGFAAPCAFIAGVLGVIIGADILNLGKVNKFGGFASIGGAGVFDGIFLTGIISALLA